MNETNAKGVCLLGRIRVKGRGFDVRGKEMPKEEFFRAEWPFRLRDVQARILIDSQRLKR